MFKISKTHPKITWQREQKNLYTLVGKEKSTETNTKITQILEHWMNYMSETFRAGIKMLHKSKYS